MGQFQHSIYFIAICTISYVACFAFSSMTSVSSSSSAFPCFGKCSFTMRQVFPQAIRFVTGVSSSVRSAFSKTFSITQPSFHFWCSQAVRRLVSKAHGMKALYGSHTAVPIVCDASNARTVAVREYHYLTEHVMAGKWTNFPVDVIGGTAHLPG